MKFKILSAFISFVLVYGLTLGAGYAIPPHEPRWSDFGLVTIFFSIVCCFIFSYKDSEYNVIKHVEPHKCDRPNAEYYGVGAQIQCTKCSQKWEVYSTKTQFHVWLQIND